MALCFTGIRRAICWQAISILLALLIGFLLVQVLDPVREHAASLGRHPFECRLGNGCRHRADIHRLSSSGCPGCATPTAIFGTDIALVVVLAWQWFRARTGRAERFQFRGAGIADFAGLGCLRWRSEWFS